MADDPNGAGTEPNATGDGDKGGAGNAPAPPDQTEIQRIATRERNEGKRAAERAIADQLGVSVADAKKIIEAHQQLEDAQKTEAQRATDEANRAKAEAEKAKADAQSIKLSSLVERQLLRASVPPAGVEEIAMMVRVEPDATVEQIDAAIESLKGKFPALFAEQAPNNDQNGGGNKPPATPAPSGVSTGGGPPANRISDSAYQSAYERGRNAARPSRANVEPSKS